MTNYHRMFQKQALHALPILVSLAAGSVLAQQDGRLTPQGEGINDPPTLEERILEEQIIADKAASEVVADDEESGIDAPLDEPGEPQTHASSEAPVELVALAAREPERFIGKTLVLEDGTEVIEVGPVLELRKRILDQEPHLIVDATSYFNTPTRYAVAVRDVDRIEGEQVITPEVEGMHLRGLDYYPEDYTDISDTSPEEVLADNADLSEEEEDAVTAPTEEPGTIPLRRF
jgi:hypothetical protein